LAQSPKISDLILPIPKRPNASLQFVLKNAYYRFFAKLISFEVSKTPVHQELSNGTFRQSYFSSDQGGKTGVMPLHNEDFPNAEQVKKNKYKCVRI